MLDIGTTLLISIAMAFCSTAITSAFSENPKTLIVVAAAVFVAFMIVITCALETLFMIMVWTFFALVFLKFIIRALSK